MKFGQMSFPKMSETADYLQLDICGLTTEQVLERYKKYNRNIPVILHGDWSKKGFSENDLLKESRLQEYINIIRTMKEHTEVLGITIHPPFRKKISFDCLLEVLNKISLETSVFIENRSSEKIWLSNPEEIIEFSKRGIMTIDIPQLFISCGYNEERFMITLENIDFTNVKEVHLANIQRNGSHTFVGRKIDDGILNIPEVLKYISEVPYVTLEILGGIKTFEGEVEKIKDCI